MDLAKVITNGILFQAGWFLCVLLGDQAALWVVPTSLVIFWLFFSRAVKDYLLILSILAFGIAGDVLVGVFGILQYPDNSVTAPLWMISLWVLFATTIPWSLRWLTDSRFKFIALSTLGGTTSYFAGVRLSDIEFGYSFNISVLLILLTWFLYGVALHCIVSFWKMAK